jgi:hypothetical protein
MQSPICHTRPPALPHPRLVASDWQRKQDDDSITGEGGPIKWKAGEKAGKRWGEMGGEAGCSKRGRAKGEAAGERVRVAPVGVCGACACPQSDTSVTNHTTCACARESVRVCVKMCV